MKARRRRRGLLLLCVALASGGLAASQVREREQDVEARVGPLTPVLVATRDLAADTELPEAAVGVKRVPARFVPPDALGSKAELVGARTAVAVAAGSYLTVAQFQPAASAGSGGTRLARGERAVEVGVAGGQGLAELGPGARVDVVVSTEAGAGGGRTFVALSGAELLALRHDAAAGYSAEGEGEVAPSALAVLRVTLRQAVYLTAADNFGREIRLLARPPGDRSSPGEGVSANDL